MKQLYFFEFDKKFDKKICRDVVVYKTNLTGLRECLFQSFYFLAAWPQIKLCPTAIMAAGQRGPTPNITPHLGPPNVTPNKP